MAIDITLPDLGDGIDSADVLEILVSVGETVSKNDGIVELETDKATAVVPSPQGGTITEILIGEGDTVEKGSILLRMDAVESADEAPAAPAAEPEQAPPAAAPAATETTAPVAPSQPEPVATQPVASQPPPQPAAPQPAAPQPAAPEVSTEQVVGGADQSEVAAGPAMRRLAREVGVDLSRVTGSGTAGRITREDIMGVVRSCGAARSPYGASSTGESDEFGPVRVEKLSRMRRTIAQQMSQSWSSVPRVTNFDDADVTDLENIRQASKEDYKTRGVKLTSMPFIIKSVAMALRDHPAINSVLSNDDKQVIYKEYVNVGIAVDTERGLVVPNMRSADQLSIPEIARQLGDMAEKVRTNNFSVDDLKGGTFTISNLGAIGGTYSTPIVNVPENAILLVGRSRKMPVVKDDQIVPRLMMPLSISYDHRLVDGAAAARFLNDVIGYLEAPSRLLLAP